MKKRDILLLALAVASGLLAVMGDGIADYANKPFWQHFWVIGGVIGVAVFLGGWALLKSKEKNAIDKENKR